MDEFNLKLQGFHPSEFTRTYLHQTMSMLRDEAPYSATLKATYTRKQDTFKGAITIYSSAGKFFAVATGKKLKHVTSSLVSQIRKQLSKWKTQRFQHESLRHLSTKDSDALSEVSHDSSQNVA